MKGFTLLEITISLGIIGLISMSAFHNYSKFMMQQERLSTLNTLKSLIEYAKNEAFRQGKNITLCIANDALHCTTQPGKHLIIFENEDKTSQPKPNSILKIQSVLQYGLLSFRAFGDNHTTLNIQENGMTQNNGTFTYCPKNGDPKEADGLIINKGSRTYKPHIRNSLGVLVKQTGNNRSEALNCL